MSAMEEQPTLSGALPKLIGFAVGLALLASLTVLVIVWPSQNSTPSDVPIGITGPPEQVTQVEAALDRSQPGGYELRTFDDGAALRQATENREIYGGWVMDPSSPGTVLATAASPLVAQVLTSVGGQLGLGSSVQDVAPTTEADPGAEGVYLVAVLVALLALIGSVVIARRMPAGVRGRLLGVLVLAVITGLILSYALQALGSVEHAYWSVAGTLALGVLAVGLPVLGLVSLGGLLLAAAYLLIITLPGIGLAGIQTPPEMLPIGFGALGQYLPTGATGSLLQSTAYFSGGGLFRPLLVLLGWVVLGLLVSVLVMIRDRRAATRRAELDAALIAEAEAEALDQTPAASPHTPAREDDARH